MFKKLRESFGKKVTVSLVILGLLFLAFYGAGFIEARWLGRNKQTITSNSSFFDRNSKEISEGFKKEIEEDGSRRNILFKVYRKLEKRWRELLRRKV